MTPINPCVLVLCGVAGSGKSTVGKLVAQELGWDFADADDFHSTANVEKMRSGTPLTDEDRWPWLDALQGWMKQQLVSEKGGILACSALKARYRERLAAAGDPVHFIFLTGSFTILEKRLLDRKDHFMPPSLLKSQLLIQEIPENAWEEDFSYPADTIAANIIGRIKP